jgi:hypothetical protein
MLKELYKRIITKLELSKPELEVLKRNLREENICIGPFQSKDKMCPNTTALSIKLNTQRFNSSSEIRSRFKENGISNLELWLFYVLFDISSMLSETYFKKRMELFRDVVDELIDKV